MNPLVYPQVDSSAAQRLAPYARVKQHLKDELSRGRWPPGAPMPSEAELVAQFGVSRMTVTRALHELQAEGLVERVQGVGTFAAHLHRAWPARCASATCTRRSTRAATATMPRCMSRARKPPATRWRSSSAWPPARRCSTR